MPRWTRSCLAIRRMRSSRACEVTGAHEPSPSPPVATITHTAYCAPAAPRPTAPPDMACKPLLDMCRSVSHEPTTLRVRQSCQCIELHIVHSSRIRVPDYPVPHSRARIEQHRLDIVDVIDIVPGAEERGCHQQVESGVPVRGSPLGEPAGHEYEQLTLRTRRNKAETVDIACPAFARALRGAFRIAGAHSPHEAFGDEVVVFGCLVPPCRMSA
jgi:hypothetical protein